MRRYPSIALFVIVLVAPLIARLALVPRGEPATSMGHAPRLVVITPHNQDIRREFATAFARWHQEHYGRAVILDYRTPGGTTDIERQLKSTFLDEHGKVRTGISDIDVVWGGGDYSFDHVLKPAGLLEPISVNRKLLAEAFPEPTLAGVRLYDSTENAAGQPTPLWIGVCLSSFGIMYNPELYTGLELPAPRTWNDLTDERLHGFISLADPAHSGSAAVAFMMVLQRAMADAEEELFAREPALRTLSKSKLTKLRIYQQAIAAGWKRGMGELVLIAANARYFTDSSEIVPGDVSRGDAAAGMAIDFYARVTEQVVGPRRAQFVLPAGATAITPDPVAILVGVRGERLDLAQHFVNYLLSPEGQRLWILKAGVFGGPIERSLWRMPIRRDVYADRTGWEPTADPFNASHGFNQRGEWMALFGDTRMIWVSAWIDSHDALADAYGAVLRVRDTGRRHQLIAALADLPIEMKDVGELAERRKRVNPDLLDEWNARQRIAFGNRFRNHYRAVAARACDEGR